MIYIVTYDLKVDEDAEDYQKLLALIKEEGVWAKLGGSSYLVESILSPAALRDKYREVLHPGDKLFVGQVSAPAAWYGLSKDVSDWIKEKLDK